MHAPLVPPPVYFVAQAALIGLWWLWMYLSEPAREMFQPGFHAPGGLLAWAPADLLLLVPASTWAGVAIAQRRALGPPLAWCCTGALGYGAAWCLTGAVWYEGAWLASQCMIAAAVGSGVSAWNAQRAAAAWRDAAERAA